MKSPFKRKKTRKKCPIHIESLYRHWERGDNRIDWHRIEKLYDAWQKGEKVPWKKLSHTFIKKLKRRDRNPATEHFVYTPPTRNRRAARGINQVNPATQDALLHDIHNWYEDDADHFRHNLPTIPLDLIYGPDTPVRERR